MLNIFWIKSYTNSRGTGILDITCTYMNMPLGSKGTTKANFESPTRGLNMGFKLIPYVNKATHITLCYVM